MKCASRNHGKVILQIEIKWRLITAENIYLICPPYGVGAEKENLAKGALKAVKIYEYNCQMTNRGLNENTDKVN